MSMMLSSTYEAFIAAGTPPDKAKEASEEIAGLDRRLLRLEVLSAITLAGTGYIIVLLHSLPNII
jgi:hypothetical protein